MNERMNEVASKVDCGRCGASLKSLPVAAHRLKWPSNRDKVEETYCLGVIRGGVSAGECWRVVWTNWLDIFLPLQVASSHNRMWRQREEGGPFLELLDYACCVISVCAKHVNRRVFKWHLYITTTTDKWYNNHNNNDYYDYYCCFICVLVRQPVH